MEDEDEEPGEWDDDLMDEAVADTLEYPVEPPAKKRKA